MGFGQSKEAEKPAPKEPEPQGPKLHISPADAEALRGCHKTLVVAGSTSVSLDTLQAHFSLPEAMARWLVTAHGDGASITAQGFVEAVNHCTDKAQRVAVMFEAFAKGGKLSQAGLTSLLEASLAMAIVVAEEFGFVKLDEQLKGATPPGTVISYLVSQLGAEEVELQGFQRFSGRHIKAVGDGLPLLLMEKARSTVGAKDAESHEGDEDSLQNAIMDLLPLISGPKTSSLLTPELVWGFGLFWSGSCPLSRLYSSGSDGFSMRTILPAINGYKGPSVIFVRDSVGRIFGGYVATEWKDGCATKRGSKFLSDSDCFLFSLLPEVRAYHAQGSAKNHVYLETEATARGMHRGFGMGGTTDKFRLFIDDSFRKVTWRDRDTSFEAAVPDSHPDEVNLQCVEIWGCGGRSAEQAKQLQKQRALEAKKKYMHDLNAKIYGGAEGRNLRDQLGGAIAGASEDVRSRAGIDKELEKKWAMEEAEAQKG